MKSPIEQVREAMDLARRTTFVAETIYMAEDVARDCGIDVDRGLAEGWIRRVDLEDDTP